MAPREVTLHVFCSNKGGVGKSVLAVATAKLLAAAGRTCILLDADLTGTSLADGLRLCAPDVALDANGDLNLDADPTGRRLSRGQTIQSRNRRSTQRWEAQPPPPPFLNDLLVHVGPGDAEGCLPALLWSHEDLDGVGYIPSSPLRHDVEIALGWLYAEESFAWLQRMAWLLQGFVEQMATLTDVVIDLSPGLIGFAHETLALISHLSRSEPLPSGFPEWKTEEIVWRTNPLLIATLDRNDLVLALEYYLRELKHLPNLRLVVNRYSEGRWVRLREAIEEHFRDKLLARDVERLLDSVQDNATSEQRVLRDVFLDGDLRLNEDARALARALRLEGVP